MDAPRDDLYRARSEAPELRATDPDESGHIGVMSGQFARFNEWTQISSAYEGHFMERVAPGAFTKTIQESMDSMRVLYDHGNDPSIGNKVLGPIRSLAESDTGADYEVPLYDTSYNRDLLPGLKDNAYGASFRFRVIKDKWNDAPSRSAYNPQGIPERTILEAAVPEFGPVTFPAYAGASSGARSLTDHYRSLYLRDVPDLGTRAPEASGRAADPDDEAALGHFGMTPEERTRVLSLIAQGVPIP